MRNAYDYVSASGITFADDWEQQVMFEKGKD